MQALLDIISPEARRKRRLGIYGVIGGIGLLLVATGWPRRSSFIWRMPTAPCGRADAQIDKAWGSVKGQAAQAMLATKVPYAKDVWVRVDNNVEKYQRGGSRRGAMPAMRRSKRKQPRVHLNLRLSCLENQLQEVAAFAEPCAAPMKRSSIAPPMPAATSVCRACARTPSCSTLRCRKSRRPARASKICIARSARCAS